LPERIIQVSVHDSVRRAFLNYAMSVLTDRALPDVRDGLKPVHRRILYSMHELGLTHDKPYKKCARIVGDVLGKYHPHGDTSVYGAAVILAQDFSTRYQLIDGHGNFGSVDGDPAAAMRYTESRLSRIGGEMLANIDKDSVPFGPNFDESEREPLVLPTLIPNLLANGTTGIAVGMATSIPPHNLGELYEAINYIIDCALEEKEADIEDIMNIIKAPDFPTGAQIIGLNDIRKGYRTGRGRVLMRSVYEFENDKGRNKIIFTEIPYKVNKAKLIETIAGLVRDKKIEGISEVRDESDKDGMRICVELKRDANPQLVANLLLKHTELQTTFSINLTVLVNGEPKEVSLKEALEAFIDHAAEVISRRTAFDLAKASKRSNVVEGILRCCESEETIDWVVHTIRKSEDPVKTLVEDAGFNIEQAEYITEMKLKALSASSEAKLRIESESLIAEMAKYNSILGDTVILMNTMKTEFNTLKEKYADERKSEIVLSSDEINEADLVEDEMLVINLSSDLLIKSVQETEYKTQGRGGKGVKVANTKEDEIIKQMLTVNSKDDLLFFTNIGRCHVLKAYKVIKTSRTARGKSLNNYLNLNVDETVVTMLCTDLTNKDNHILFVTEQGIIKRLSLEDLSTRMTVTRVLGFKEGDFLKQAMIVAPTDNVIITTALGQSIRVKMDAEDHKAIRPMGRGAAGVIGINVDDNDKVVDMALVEPDATLLIVSENGMGKRTNLDDFPVHGRGGKGVIGYKVTEKTGVVLAAISVKEDDELFVASEQGLITRINVKNISTMGRSTSGVKIMSLNEGDKIGSISNSRE
jgi:DNA gyrase subunit A